MNDRSALLDQLKLDRDPLPPPDGRSPQRWWFAALAVVVIAAAAFWLLRPDAAVPVKTAVARGLAGAGTADASVLDASGYVVARRQATVSSKITGKVVELLIEEGQRVKAGDVLARIDDSNTRAQLALAESQLEAAKAALSEIQVQLAEAERQARRARELAASGLVSQADLDAAEARAATLRAQLDSVRKNVDVAGKSVAVQAQVLDDTIVRAPFDGVITVKNAQPGEMISPLAVGGEGTRTGIGTLVDMDSLEIEVDVNENFINRVVPGQPVTARLNAYPDLALPAKVIAVIPTADRSKATVRVRIGLETRDPRVLPDMGVRVSFLAEPQAGGAGEAAAQGVLVPAEAVTGDGASASVYVVSGEPPAAQRREVTVSGRRSDGVQITAGLREGERVVIGDTAKLHDGQRVRPL